MSTKLKANTVASDVEDSDNAVTMYSETGEKVTDSEKARQIHSACGSEKHFTSVNLIDEPRQGRMFQRVLERGSHFFTYKIRLGDGRIREISADAYAIECAPGSEISCCCNGERCIISYHKTVKTVEPEKTEVSSATLSDPTLKSIAGTIRVETPGGTIPLDKLMIDISTGHSEVEQYKNGAISVAKAIDDRIEIEQNTTNDGDTIEALELVKQSALDLNDRIDD